MQTTLLKASARGRCDHRWDDNSRKAKYTLEIQELLKPENWEQPLWICFSKLPLSSSTIHSDRKNPDKTVYFISVFALEVEEISEVSSTFAASPIMQKNSGCAWVYGNNCGVVENSYKGVITRIAADAVSFLKKKIHTEGVLNL